MYICVFCNCEINFMWRFKKLPVWTVKIIIVIAISVIYNSSNYIIIIVIIIINSGHYYVQYALNCSQSVQCVCAIVIVTLIYCLITFSAVY